MHSPWSFALGFLAPLSALAPGQNVEQRCNQFTLSMPGVALSGTTHYTANTTVAIATPQSTINTTALPAFCRVELVVTTNASAGSSARTELWLPDDWNGRLLTVGNGGLSGRVNIVDLGYLAVRQGCISTDTGHESSSFDGRWAGPHNDNAIIDFAYRALHLSVVHGKELVKQYYGKSIKKSYYIGCSTGGRQGLKEAQEFPDDFDGIIVGSPANWMSHLVSWALHLNQQVQPTTSPRFMPASLWTDVIAPEVLRQCDALDGLTDGIINDPRVCTFRPETLTCRPNQDRSTCLTSLQIDALHHIYADYYEANQTYVFGRYYPGGEDGYFGWYAGATPFSIGVDYFRYFVLNDTSFTVPDYTAQTLALAEKLDVGHIDATSPDLRAFAARGGKAVHYAGWADPLISAGNAVHYYETVHRFTTAHTAVDVDDFFRLFLVGGMGHCVGGAGATSFGAADDEQPPLSDDPQHNVLAALVRWVEAGVAPDNFTAAHYTNGDAAQGVDFTRPVCRYPLSVRYVGGDPKSADSFECVVVT